MALTCAAMRGSSQVFIDVRSITSAPGKASSTSSKNGPENDFSATLVTIVETPNSLAALATRAALLRSSTMLVDCVANAICDWKSIRTSVWSDGLSSSLPGVGWAWGMVTPWGRGRFRCG